DVVGRRLHFLGIRPDVSKRGIHFERAAPAPGQTSIADYFPQISLGKAGVSKMQYNRRRGSAIASVIGASNSFGSASARGGIMKKLSIAIGGVLLLCIGVVAAKSLVQQDKSKRPSPPARTEWAFADGKKIVVDYSSPRMKGRKIYGELVPFGQVWRAGANEATTFVTDTDLSVGGLPVLKGSYTLFTITNRDKWTLIISKKTGEWGIPY